MVDSLHRFNESIDLLFNNGSVTDASIKVFETAWTFGGVVWLWPIAFLGTLIMVAIKSENPTAVAMYAILGNLFLGTRLDQISHVIFGMTLIFSVLIFLYSLFVSPRTE